MTELLRFVSLPLYKRHAVWLEELFGFDAVVHLRVPVMYFSLGVAPRIYKTAKYEPAKIEG